MSKLKTRSLFYRRATWQGKATETLETIFHRAALNLTATKLRTFPHSGGGEMQGLYAIPQKDLGFFVQVALYVPRQATSIVPFPSKENEKKISSQLPPDEHNYLEGDTFFLISGNDVLICPSGTREMLAIVYIFEVLRAGKESMKLIERLSIEPIAKVDKVNLLRKEGVKKIELKSSLFEATHDHVERTTAKKTLLNSIAKEFVSLVYKDGSKSLPEISELENLSVRVEISFDSRKKGGTVGKKRIENAAQRFVKDHEDEGLMITTGKGNILSASSIRISEKVQLEPHGNSVSRDDVLANLGKYLSRLKANGILSQ